MRSSVNRTLIPPDIPRLVFFLLPVPDSSTPQEPGCRACRSKPRSKIKLKSKLKSNAHRGTNVQVGQNDQSASTLRSRIVLTAAPASTLRLLGSDCKSENNDIDALMLSVAFLLYRPKLNLAEGDHDYGRMKRQSTRSRANRYLSSVPCICKASISSQSHQGCQLFITSDLILLSNQIFTLTES